MKTKIALVCVLALTMGLVASAAIAKPADKSTGGVEYLTGQGNPVKASFNAHGDALNAKGRVNVRGHHTGGPDPAFADFKGDVTCYLNRGENEATFTGEITHFNGEGPSGFFNIHVFEGDETTPDRISVGRSDTDMPCEPHGPASRMVHAGNLKVHHR